MRIIGCPQVVYELDALYTEAGCVDLDAAANIVKSHNGTLISLVKPKSYSVRVCGQDDTVYKGNEDQLEAWKDFYLPERMEMVVIGAIDDFSCEAFGLQLVLLLCEDGKIYAYDDEVLHLVARNVKELHETGLTFPGFESYNLGECFEDYTEEEYNEIMESKEMKEMKEAHEKYRKALELELLESLQEIQRNQSKMLHSIFFLGYIHKPTLTPENFLNNTSLSEIALKLFPGPIKKYRTHLPFRTPFSILLDMMEIIHGTEEKMLTEIPLLLKKLGFPPHLHKAGNKYEQFYTLESTEKRQANSTNYWPFQTLPLKEAMGFVRNDVNVWHQLVVELWISMAVAECPDYFALHPKYQDNVDSTSSGGSASLIHFQQPSVSSSAHHPDDDVDLEALVNDMTSLSPYEGLYSFKTQHSDTVPLLHNGQGAGIQINRIAPPSYLSNSRAKANLSTAQKACCSQPVHILAVRRLQQEEQQVRPASLPAIPNPFPELCSPAGSPILNAGSMPQPSDVHIIKVLSEDGVGKVLEVPAHMTARDVCQLLVYKSHCLDDNCWTLVEHHPLLGIERYLEDHELVVQVKAHMPPESKFLFRKNYAKYEFFKNPLNFLNSSRCPEIQGFLYMKDTGRKSWKKLYMFLRRSGLYYSTKGISWRSMAVFLTGTCGRPCNEMLNPVEAMMLLHGGRVRTTLCLEIIHRTQLWFHGRIMREESHRMMKQQGQVDGLFLLRDSQSNPKAFVLTLCHHQKIRHFQILPYEEDGQIFFSLDDGSTKFTDLIHLVEFYQLNRGVLPCKLKHPCTMVAL
ncbi:Growth factor receptor-bound protein 10 [Bagarius yarrelli]|uniref:Growth factor receptor-bound protein 10 n=1 Tax=Bagarius yarrelli TaxID=175774 RepID=A0A556U9G5_BAGYA|nr:Growth factor receptor-bound protein 10 [Bagarius yarrelli]